MVLGKAVPSSPGSEEVSVAAGSAVSPVEESAVQKAAWRLIPLLILIYVLSYIDRINLGFAALTMSADLGLTVTMIGIANTAFYIAYVVFEIPSNLALDRFGARIWIPRIMISWGLVTAAMAYFIQGQYSLYVMRALLGMAEAGLMPGIIFYIASWFPERRRAQMNSFFLLAVPLSLFIGAPLSGLILGLDGALGLQGWQWLFLLTGMAPVLLGVAVFFVLPTSPQSAPWLSDSEKQALIARLDAEGVASREKKSAAAVQKSHWTWGDVLNLPTLTFGIVFFSLVSSNNMVGTWVPLIVNDLFGGKESISFVSIISALPALAAVIGMYLVGKYSDKTGNRIAPLIGGMVTAACGWLLCSAPVAPELKVVGLMMGYSGSYSAMVVFWVIATHLIPKESRAAGIALITTIGLTSTIVNSPLTGLLRDWSGSYTISMWYEATIISIGVTLVLMFIIPRYRAARDAT